MNNFGIFRMNKVSIGLINEQHESFLEYQILVPEAQQLLELFYYRQVTDAPPMIDFPENEGDSRKLKKMLALVQHFNNLDIYVPQQNIGTNNKFYKL